MRCRASNRGRRAMNQLLTLLCTLLLLAGAPGAAIAVDNGDDVAKTETPAGSNLLFIPVAPGSWWGRVDGEPKTFVAKAVRSRLVRPLPAYAQAGLTASGPARHGAD